MAAMSPARSAFGTITESSRGSAASLRISCAMKGLSTALSLTATTLLPQSSADSARAASSSAALFSDGGTASSRSMNTASAPRQPPWRRDGSDARERPDRPASAAEGPSSCLLCETELAQDGLIVLPDVGHRIHPRRQARNGESGQEAHHRSAWRAHRLHPVAGAELFVLQEGLD